MEAYNCDNVPKMNYMLHRLSVEAGYRDQGELEQLITDHISSQTAALVAPWTNEYASSGNI